MTTPLIATATDTTTPFSGAYLIEDGRILADALASGDWVEGGIATFTAAIDIAATVVDPVGTLIANGLGWVLDHIEPLKTWLTDMSGSPGDVAAFSQTWHNIATRLHSSADTYARRTHDLDTMSGATIDAYLGLAADTIAHLHASGDWATAIAGAMETAASMVQLVHDLVRDSISQIVGTAISIATELALTVGFATPIAVGQITTRAATLATRAGATITRLLRSLKALHGIFDALTALFDKTGALVSKMLRGGGTPSRGAAASQGPSSAARRTTPIAKPPPVKDPDLHNRLKDAYLREGFTSKIDGDGSLVTAIRHELRTGELVGGRDHVAKGEQVINSMNNWLRRHRDADPSDIEVAQRMIKEIRDALDGK